MSAQGEGCQVDGLPIPNGPLSMSLLVQLEPPALRRLLKAGLRRGATAAELEEILLAGWGWSLVSQEAQQLLALLVERGWLTTDGVVWKTRFG